MFHLLPFSSYLTLNNIVTLKCRLGSVEVIGNGTIQKLWYGFLFAFHSNYGSILYHFGDKARYWSNIVIFQYPLAFDAQDREVTVRILPFCSVCINQNGLAIRRRKKFDDILAISIEYRRVHDGQTSYDGLVRAMHSIAR